MRGPQGSDLPPSTSSTCSQCGHRFPYLEDVGLEIAEYILEQHSQLCSRLSSQKRIHMALWPEWSGTSNIGASSTTDRIGSQEGIGASEILDTVKKRRKYETDMMGRKAVLEADPYGRDVTAKSIVCNGCDKTIRLDRRNDYYPGLWVKHRDKCQARAQPPKRTARETANEVVRGEKVGVGGKRKAETRARTLSPTQGYNFEPSTRPRSWSGVSVVGTSARPMPAGAQVLSLRHAGPLAPLGDDFREMGKSEPVPTAAAPHAPQMHVDIAHPLPMGPIPLSEKYDLPAMVRERSLSIGSSTSAPSVGSGHAPLVDVASHSLFSRGRKTDTYPFLWEEDNDSNEDVNSDRYWSEAPFATGPDQWAERGRYRYSTRRELMHIFQQRRTREFDEMPPASPCSSDDCSSPGEHYELREMRGDEF